MSSEKIFLSCEIFSNHLNEESMLVAHVTVTIPPDSTDVSVGCCVIPKSEMRHGFSESLKTFIRNLEPDCVIKIISLEQHILRGDSLNFISQKLTRYGYCCRRRDDFSLE